jgi:hypothetical protein
MSSNRVFQVFVFVFLLVSLSVGFELPPAQAAPTSDTLCNASTNLVGFWRMEEGSGSTLIDGSGNGLNATINGIMHWEPGRIGNYSLVLDDKNPYASVANNPKLQIANAISLAAWINPKSVNNYTIISKYVTSSTTGSTDGFQLSLAGDSAPVNGHEKRIYLRLNQKSSQNTYRVSTNTPYDTNAWTFVVATYDGTADGRPMNIYRNGGLDILGGHAVTGPTSIATNALNLNIGKENNDGYYFWGSLDDVRIYNCALTLAQINALFLSPTAVNLASFTGFSLGSTVHLAWTTASEEDLVGFNLYRSESASGEAKLVNSSPIPAQNIGQLTGASYQFTDIVNLGQHYFYRLELVKQDGNWPGPQVGVKTGYWVHLPLLVH